MTALQLGPPVALARERAALRARCYRAAALVEGQPVFSAGAGRFAITITRPGSDSDGYSPSYHSKGRVRHR